MVLPGDYEVRLTAGGETLRKPITVTLDPRFHVSAQDLRRQLELSQDIAAAMAATYQVFNDATRLRTDAADAQQEKLKAVADSVGPLNRDLTRLLIGVDQSDTAPAAMMVEQWNALCQDTKAALARWNGVRPESAPKAPPELNCASRP